MATDSPTPDWAGRYYHIDQVLNAGGPRTDPQFAAGDEVDILLTNYTCFNRAIGEEIPQRNSKNPGHWCRGVRV